jgi:class 3 adenylate cyclase/CHASE2 domain-containing sensor protein
VKISGSTLKRNVVCLFAGLATFFLVYFLSAGTKLFDAMDNSLLDGFFYLRAPAPYEENPFLSERVRLIGFDEDSLAAIGKWPWKRYVHARFLDKIERYSPETVFFDIIFAKPETMPDFINSRLDVSPEVLEKFNQAFAEMDSELGRALARYDNVYLDLQLMPADRPELPESYIARIRRNEELAIANGLPADKVRSPNVFHSLEPVLDKFVKSAHPSVTNIYPDGDGVVRFFPAYYTYQTQDGRQHNLMTIVVSLLQRLYHLPTENIAIEQGRVVLRQAVVPVLHQHSHKQLRLRQDFGAIAARISNPAPPASYRYNRNLEHYLVNRLQRAEASTARVPEYPLHVLVHADNSLEIVDGWEVLAAARKAKAQKMDILPYERKDVEIKTPLGSFFYINYAGNETKIVKDEESGEKTIISTIPTEGYKEIYTMPEIPDLPELTGAGTLAEPDTLPAVAPWFFSFCEQQFYRLYRRAAEQLPPEELADEAGLLEFVSKYPASRYFYYHYFFLATAARPDQLPALINSYPAFGREIGQNERDFLSEQQLVAALNEHYGLQFDKYYNKFIFAGASALGLADVHTTPYDKMFGPNIIINAFNTIATDNQLAMSIDVPRFDFMLLLFLATFFSLVYGFVNIRHGAYLFVILFLGTFVGSYILFSTSNFYLRTTPLLIANIMIFVEMVIFKLLTEEKDKKFLKANFSQYLAPELIDEMFRSHSLPKLGGELKNITAYFTDIQGFSSFSEKLSAPQLVELLNEYMGRMTDILLAEKGTLDKYEGDAIIAFFGAPLDLPDHALRACRVALAMQEDLLQLRAKWGAEKQGADEEERNVKQFGPEEWVPGARWPNVVHRMQMRIGINTGEIVVGNMGSAIRKNYTMMGDAVNLAARLEGAAKQYGVCILISDYVLEREFADGQGRMVKTRDFVELRYLDKITVLGKSEPVKVYELCAMKGGLSESEKELVRIFNAGMAHYLGMEWDQAGACFQESLALERGPDGATTPSGVFLKRCAMFKANPPVEPGREWDGVFRLTSK